MAFLADLAAYGDRVTVWPDDERGCSRWTRSSARRPTVC